MINIAYFTALILIFLRMTAFFTVVPVFFPKGLPNAAKVAFALVLSYMLIPGINYSNLNITSNYILFSLGINEVITGLTLGFITNLCFFSARFAGQLIDMQIGFSMISMFDPSTSSNSTLLEHVLYWCSLLLFFVIDGHHMLLRALIESFNAISLGKFVLSGESINLIFNGFIEFFSIGLKIAIPVVLIILITDIVLGLIGRTVPQINLMILGLPIKILVGLTAFTFAMPILFKLIGSSFVNIQDILKGFFKAAPLMIIFASDDKTEEATPKKKKDARKKGQVARSKEVNLAFTLLVSTLLLLVLGAYVGGSLKATLITFLNNFLLTELDYNSVKSLTLTVIWRLAITLLPVVVPIMAMGILANFVQVGFIITGEPLKPQLSKLNPISGFKRMFSYRTFVETLKDLAIVSVLGYTGYKFIIDNYDYLLKISSLRIGAVPSAFVKLIVNVFSKVTIIMIIIALADYLYQKFQYNKELRMTKQEIKEEFKQQEGDPQIKSKIRQKQREMSQRRMMQSVSDATVVVTNPTHIACALKYEEGKDGAPKLVAKGADNIAIKIKDIAKENNVPIIENRALARLIYFDVEIDEEIPAEMYQAVAEVLALVYKMKKKK
ncbi:fused FliR family export protein/FlhB family type III secretion system protein [Clostridium sp. SYSU_GA19001]|uniref:fused FliR family export protein/FlhB family type III secretion system protein n=1 Tax=Clostridium caldaquaticum TaxID=2940653 RepID=UPI002077773B|nr:fused FliR family export protein/FlhB family type III secretion system protein [Clostridium caldaquaticum]MCM8710983.1 fused FliR family export protein/FlhB family type III secretion system protein [Clostridium caldaquaticum]